jgi:hypothetical protein
MPSLEVMEATVSGIVSAKLPSVTALALSLVVSFLLLALIRVAFKRLVTISDITDDKSNVDVNEKGAPHSCSPHDSQSPKYGVMSSWMSWRWEGLPVSLPVALSINGKDNPSFGVGMGVVSAMQQQQQQEQECQPPKIPWQKHRRSPGFVPPCKCP